MYVHTAERGFHNYEAPTRWEVRLGHLDVAEADEELRAPVDVARVRRMLAKIGYPDPDGRVGLGSRLTAYYVTGPAGDAGLREAVARQLPESVVPERFVAVDRIPRGANGAHDSFIRAVGGSRQMHWIRRWDRLRDQALKRATESI